MSTSAIQTNTWLQQLPESVRTAVDGNKDGGLDTKEVVDFLEQFLAAVKGTTGTTTAAATGATMATTATSQAPVASTPGSPVSDTEPATSTNPVSGTASTSGTWRDFVFGKSTAGNYAGVMVAPTREIGAGYQVGAFRHQLEGFNEAKFDPAHAEGMTLKMIAARVFEQFDVYSETSFDAVVQAFNDLGIAATKVGFDKIDFGNGEGPVDVIRNAAWLDGDTSAGMAWQWAPENDVDPMNFTMNGGIAPVGTATPGLDGTTPTDGVVAPVDGALPAASLYPGAVDQLDVSAVNWLHANVANWPVTSKITDVEIGASSITIEHSKAGDWPTFNYNGVEIEGNPWVFVNRGGQWYGATYDWLRPGQTEKAVTGDDIGENIKAEPLASWTPKAGELVGFMVSTPARDGNRTSNERSNVVMTRWPA